MVPGLDRIALPVTLPINSIKDILNKFAVCFKVFPRGFSRLLTISVLSCGLSASFADIY